MQAKISAFFKPSPTTASKATASSPDYVIPTDAAGGPCEEPEISVTYKRRAKIPPMENNGESGELINVVDKVNTPGKVMNKKRNYAQFHLELGQSDFLLHACKVCGFEYSKGDEGDEKVHNTFHKNHILGIPFKGWRNERVVDFPLPEVGRILLVLGDDPPARKNKVKEIVEMMETELGEGWIYNQHCKVYLYISSGRISGCLVAEPIEKAYWAFSSAPNKLARLQNGKERKENSMVLKFGEVSFHREVMRKKCYTESPETCDMSPGVMLCENEAVPAKCGVRAIWVSPSKRRKHIATFLLDALRSSFCTEPALNRSDLAFSQPTSAGEVLISNYIGGRSFLVYTTTRV